MTGTFSVPSMLPPECIRKYTFRSVIGRIQCAPTVDGFLSLTAMGQFLPSQQKDSKNDF